MLLQASMNTFKKWFVEIVEIPKTVSYEPAYHWIKGETFGRRNGQPCLNFTFSEKWPTISNQSVTQWVFRACFLRMHNIWFFGNSGWKRYSHVILGNQSRSMFCFMVIIEKNLPRTCKYFEKV